MNPAEWLYRSAARNPQSPALLQGTERKANYLEFARSAGAISAALAGYGIGKETGSHCLPQIPRAIWKRFTASGGVAAQPCR